MTAPTREIVLLRFFRGEAAARDLAREVRTGIERLPPVGGARMTRHHVENMQEDFEVEPHHLVSLIDATLAGDLTAGDLEALAFLIEASDHFQWDADTPGGAQVAEGLFWMASPEINFPLTPSTLREIRQYLLTGENRLGGEPDHDGR